MRNKILKILEDTMMAYSDDCTSPSYHVITRYNNEKTGIQFYIGKDSKNNYMFSFRGTDELKDWLEDLKFKKAKVPYNNQKTNIRIHTGFYQAFQTIRADITKLIKTKMSENNINYTINIMGHSYGAALAVLCALDIQYNFPYIDLNVTTFGCPRIGNKSFSSSYNKRVPKTLRIENGNDIVTKLPFKIMGYKHCGIRIHIGHLRLFGLFSIKQHLCCKYYESLWNK